MQRAPLVSPDEPLVCRCSVVMPETDNGCSRGSKQHIYGGLVLTCVADKLRSHHQVLQAFLFSPVSESSLQFTGHLPCSKRPKLCLASLTLQSKLSTIYDRG